MTGQDEKRTEIKPTRIRLSVRDLVAPLVRTGSLEWGVGGVALRRGVEWHARIQSWRARSHPSFVKERAVSGVFSLDNADVEISGRVDGLWGEAPVTMEEIKSTTSLDRLEHELHDGHPFVLQLKMYAFLYWLETGDTPRCQLLLVSAYDGERREIPVAWDPQDMSGWVSARLLAWQSIWKAMTRDGQRKMSLAADLIFPHRKFRPGQADLVAWVADGVQQGGQAMVQAPTGSGKTSAALFPVLKFALQHRQQVVYCTAKNTQQTVVCDAVRRFHKRGLKVKTVVLTAKEKACLMDAVVCDPKVCPFARDYYDKCHENSLVDRLCDEDLLDGNRFREMGREFQVCPFELSLNVLPRMDLVIGDYNYVIAPRISLFDDAERAGQGRHLIIDEGHNLFARSMEHYSPVLDGVEVKRLHQAASVLPAKFSRSLKRILTDLTVYLESLQERWGWGSHRVEGPFDPLSRMEHRLGRLLMNYLRHEPAFVENHPLLNSYRLVTDFCHVMRLADERFAFCLHAGREGPPRLKALCLDPSSLLGERIQLFSSSVLLSATLKPFSFFAQLSGLDASRLRVMEMKSSFPRDQCKILVIPQVSTVFRRREQEAPRIAEVISRIIPLKKGNYLVFFPSFAFLNRVKPLIELKGFRVFAQQSQMSVRDREKLLGKFSQKTRNVVVLAVQGGIFAEGVDLPGDKLIGAIVVGPGLPLFDFERQCLRDYYENVYGKGFAYAFVYPGMVRSVQAAGRVIRSERDRGLVVLLGRRFLEKDYVEVMPSHWYDSSPRELVSRSILNDIKAFWREGTAGKGVRDRTTGANR